MVSTLFCFNVRDSSIQPVQIDYSDLHNIMSFFVGPPDALGSGRDDLARDIAQQARLFGMEHWRWEDMQAYMFRTLLE